jgi:ribosomal protein L35AE/L33A
MVTGRVVQFRRGRHIITEKHMLIEVSDVKNREEASKLVGKEVEWTSPAGKIIKGKISSAHGNKGVFELFLKRVYLDKLLQLM